MENYFKKIEMPKCNCAARKNAVYQDTYNEIITNVSNQSVDILILLEHKEIPEKLEVFKKLCKRILSQYSYAIIPALGCTPEGFSSSDTVSTYKKCKDLHIKNIIHKLNPKVIVSTGRSIYTITESKSLKHNHFFIPVNGAELSFQIEDTFIYSSEFNCNVFPISPLYQWITSDILDVYEYKFALQQFKRATEDLHRRKRKISICHFIEEKDPNQFLKELINNQTIKKIAIDTETTGLNWMKDKIFSIQFSFDRYRGHYCEFDKIDIRLLIELFDRKDILFVYQNPQFDIKMLKQAKIYNAHCDFDTMTAAHILNENSPNGLKSLTWLYTNYGGYENKLNAYIKENKFKSFKELPKELLLEYACMDAIVTLLIQEYFEERFELEDESVKNNYYNYVIPAIEMIIDVEMTGVQIDLNYMDKYVKKLKRKADKIEQEIYKIANKEFNLNSGKQLSTVFRNIPNFSPITNEDGSPLLTKSGDLILDKDTLERYANEKGYDFAKLIIEYNHISKEISQLGFSDKNKNNKNLKKSLFFFEEETSEENENIGFLASMHEGRLYGGYKLYGTETGRASGGGGLSSSINPQNFPATEEFRKLFLASDGYMLGMADYDAMEIAITSQISGSGPLEKVILSGKDPHCYLAVNLAKLQGLETTYDEINLKSKDKEEIKKDPKFKNLRGDSKTLGFQAIYGATEFGLANTFGVDLEEAKEFLQIYRKTFPEVAQYIDESKRFAQENGYIKTLLGRKRRLPELTYIGKDSWSRYANKNSTFKLNNSMNSAINNPIQGTSGQTTLIAMTKIYQTFKEQQMKSRIIINVHDEIVFELFILELQKAKEIIKFWMIFPYYENKDNCKVRLNADLDYGEIWKFDMYSTEYWNDHTDKWKRCLENNKIRNEKLKEKINHDKMPAM